MGRKNKHVQADDFLDYESQKDEYYFPKHNSYDTLIYMNDKDLENYLRENVRLNRENNELLKKINSRQKWSRNWTIFYWVVILGAAILGYYYAFPYFQDFKQQLSGVITEASKLTHFTGQNATQ